MTPDRRAVVAPPLFDAFTERSTRGQRARRRRALVYTALYRMRQRWQRR